MTLPALLLSVFGVNSASFWRSCVGNWTGGRAERHERWKGGLRRDGGGERSGADLLHEAQPQPVRLHGGVQVHGTALADVMCLIRRD